MRFKTKKISNKEKKTLLYIEEDYSFDMGINCETIGVSVLINEISLDINEKNEIISVWGFCPLINCLHTKCFPEFIQKKLLLVDSFNRPPPGVSIRYNDNTRWKVYHNIEKGWICVGDPNSIDCVSIEFLPNCVVSLKDTELKSLWLKPFFQQKQE